MIRVKWLAICPTACALACGSAFAQVVGDWTGDGTTHFDDGASWYQGAIPNGTIVMAFSPDFSVGPSANNLSMDVAGSALGIDVESGAVSGGANISITGASTLTLGSSGLSMNQVFHTAFNIADISAPLKLSASQTWNIGSSDLTVGSAISETSAGTTLAIAVNGSANIALNTANSTFSGGLTLTGGAGAVLVVGASSVGPAGAPTSGPVGTGTLTLGSGVELFSPSGTTITLGNNVFVGAGTETIDGALGGDLILRGVISGPGTIQAVNSTTTVDFEGNNNFTGGTVLDFATVNIGNDHGLGTGPVSAFGNTLNFTSNFPGIGIPSFSFNQSVANFTQIGGEPNLTDLTLFESTLNFSADSILSIIDMASDGPGSTNAINLGNTSVLFLRVDGPTSYYGTITGPNAFMTVGSASTGVMDFFGANTYTGGTTIGNSVLVIADNNTALGSGSISLIGGGASLGVGSGVTITNTISTFNNGSTLEGYGAISPGGISFINDAHGSVIVGGKGSLPLAGFATSAVPGTLTFGANAHILLGNDGIMQFSIMNATGTPGTDFSAISAPSSTATVSAIPTMPFTIQLVSVNPATGQQGLANFNDTLSYSWTLLSALAVTGFTGPNQFTVDDTTDFLNSLGGGSFSVSVVGGDLLTLSFTPVPEPSTWALMATGLCVLGAAVRRRRR